MSRSRPRIGVTRWEDVPGELIEQYWDRVREAGGGIIYQVLTYKANEIVPLDNTFQVRADSTAS